MQCDPPLLASKLCVPGGTGTLFLKDWEVVMSGSMIFAYAIYASGTNNDTHKYIQDLHIEHISLYPIISHT